MSVTLYPSAVRFNDNGTYRSVAAFADLNSPSLIGTPTAPTAEPGTNTTQIATTAFANRAANNAVSTFVRPNLLDNWYFVGGGSQLGYGVFPINQRGQSVYSTSGAYTIDRWKLNSSGTVTVGADGITFASTGGWQSLRQYLSSYKALSGKPVTISALVSTEATQNLYMVLEYQSGGSEHGVCYQTSNTSGLRLVTVSATAPDLSDATQAYFRIGNVAGATTSPIKIIAVKLEVGSTQTLAHQEGSTWVLNEIPDYAEQLIACQHYAVLLPGTSVYNGYANSETVVRIAVPCPAQFAGTPSLEYGGTGFSYLRLIGNGVALSPTSATALNAGNEIVLEFTVSGATQNATYALKNNGATILIYC